MEKQAPALSKIVLMAVFALSCFAILLFLWKSFGGPVPLDPKGYRFDVRVLEATQLADNADVRISGVTVGRVIDSELDRDKTRVEIEIDSRYAPIPRNTKAILRSKTLLGETYVELTPGDRRSGMLGDGDALPDAQVRPTVELDEVLRALDARTRRDLQRFVKGLDASFRGRGEDLNDALGNVPPFSEDTGTLLDTLDTQQDALSRLVHDTGTVLGELGRRDGELSGLVEATDTILTTTARRNGELEEAVRILPTTLRELRPALREIEGFALDAGPVVHALRPAARALDPALRDASAAAPELIGLFRDIDRVIDVSRTALPDTTRTVRAAHPLFQRLDVVLREALPVVDYLGLFPNELTATFAGLAASTQGSEVQVAGGRPLHYLRALVPFTVEGFAFAPERYGSNRYNPYFAPRALDKLATGLESFDCSHTGNPAVGPAPLCEVQEPFEFRGRKLAYPHVTRDP